MCQSLRLKLDIVQCPQHAHKFYGLEVFAQTTPTPLHVDNTSGIRITENPILHYHTKHIEVYCHFIREEFERDVISLPHVSTLYRATAC